MPTMRHSCPPFVAGRHAPNHRGRTQAGSLIRLLVHDRVCSAVLLQKPSGKCISLVVLLDSHGRNKVWCSWTTKPTKKEGRQEKALTYTACKQFHSTNNSNNMELGHPKRNFFWKTSVFLTPDAPFSSTTPCSSTSMVSHPPQKATFGQDFLGVQLRLGHGSTTR